MNTTPSSYQALQRIVDTLPTEQNGEPLTETDLTRLAITHSLGVKDLVNWERRYLENNLELPYDELEDFKTVVEQKLLSHYTNL